LTIPNAEKLSQEQVADITQRLSQGQTEADLFEEIGKSLGPGAAGEAPEERGRQAVRRMIPRIRAAVCQNEGLKSFCENPNVVDETHVLIAIAGALMTAHFGGVNPVLLAFLIGRIGLRKMCSGEWKP
jgi:hypothetical protein